MNSDDELEALLGRLTPAPPPPGLMERLRRVKPPAPPSRLRLLAWIPPAAAAALAFAWLGQPAPPAAPEPIAKPQERQPVGSVQHLIEIADLGIVQGSDDRPIRLIRTRWLDEILYEAPGGEPLKEGRIREEVLPVSVPLY